MSWIYDEYTIEFNNSWNGYKEHGPEHGRYFHECSGVKKWGSSMFFFRGHGEIVVISIPMDCMEIPSGYD